MHCTSLSNIILFPILFLSANCLSYVQSNSFFASNEQFCPLKFFLGIHLLTLVPFAFVFSTNTLVQATNSVLTSELGIARWTASHRRRFESSHGRFLLAKLPL